MIVQKGWLRKRIVGERRERGGTGFLGGVFKKDLGIF